MQFIIKYTLVAVTIILAALNIESSAGVFSETYDEPFHIACGMEWLDKGRYTYEMQHPPLARIVVSVVPYLKGLKSSSLPLAINEGNSILSSNGNFRANLADARRGNLFFFVIAALTVFWWAKRWFDDLSALLATLLFCCLPAVLGHAGIATLDMASAATVSFALFCILQCLSKPGWSNLIVLGFSLGVAFLCKFSSFPFLGICLIGTVTSKVLQNPRVATRSLLSRRTLVRATAVGGVALLTLWAGYRFSLKPISTNVGSHLRVDAALSKWPSARHAVDQALETPIPFSEVVNGFRELRAHNAKGGDSYLLGQYRSSGWWYFFPVGLAVKTPIGFLILSVYGVVSIVRRPVLTKWPQILTVVFPALILIVCMSSSIDLGTRHILAIYPPLAVIAGYAASKLIKIAWNTSRALAIVPACLLISVAVDAVAARPYYLAYFNQFASAHPERVLVESDLDWGQDLYLLSSRLRALHADHVAIKYFGTSPLGEAGLPPYSLLHDAPGTSHGYAAISVRYLTLDYAKNRSFAWLKGNYPTEIVGKSIYLFKLP